MQTKDLSSATATVPIISDASAPPLFGSLQPSRPLALSSEVSVAAGRGRASAQISNDLDPGPDERMLEVFRRAKDPGNPFELRDLWLARVECELGPHGRHERSTPWINSRIHRSIHAEEVLESRSTVRFVKELFNTYFRDDLFGSLQTHELVPLSGGSVDEIKWGLPETLKACMRYALDRDWYGYSDSRGRMSAREAVASYENGRIIGGGYTADNVALTMGATFTISTLADLLLSRRGQSGPAALCAIPNYPPLVESVARRGAIKLVPLAIRSGTTSLEPLIAALTPTTPLVLLQTVANPTGRAVSEMELAELIRRASPSTMIILDECHEWLGPSAPSATARRAPNVIRVSSISKTWSAPGLKVGWFLADESLIAEYYEHASTTFGGPPSYLYTLVEVLARMERWLECGIGVPGLSELGEFESGYGLLLSNLQAAYESYRTERIKRSDILAELRGATVAQLADIGAVTIPPLFSINVATQFPGYEDSYLCFRDLLRESQVSVFPCLLTFCLSGGMCRVTTSRSWEDLQEAFRRLRALANAGWSPSRPVIRAIV